MGNGFNIRFWEDRWMDGKPLALSKFSRLMELLKADVGGRVGDYIDQGRRWKKLHKKDYSHEDIDKRTKTPFTTLGGYYGLGLNPKWKFHYKISIYFHV